MMLSNSGHDENGKYSGGKAGDQGGEWSRIKWYNRPWNVVLRYPDRSVGTLIAQLAGEAADNDHIGYDQLQRTTFWQQLKNVGYYPSRITVDCEADCSAGVAAIVKASGYIVGNSKLQSISPDAYTGNLKSALNGVGFSVLTDSKYLTSDEYLLPGDILLYEGHHTAINLDTGSKVMALTGDALRQSVANAAKRAKNEGWTYGDCHTNPPCPPIACDRGIFRALWDLDPKFRDQKAGGETVYTADSYLTSHGFIKNTSQSKVLANDIVFMKWTGSKAFDWRDHMFFCVSYDPNTQRCDKYDFGEQWRINEGSYFTNVAFNEWTTTPIKRVFYASYRFPGGQEPYVFTPSDVKSGSTGPSQYLATEILKAYGIKGVKKDGKPQDIELNGKWTQGDMAALAQWKLDRIRNGDANLCKGPYGAGEAGPNDWLSLLSSGLPFRAVNIPDQESHGPSVLLAQRILRANGYKGEDGKSLTLDAQFGNNTEYAIRNWQKANGRQVTGKLNYDDWKVMLKNI